MPQNPLNAPVGMKYGHINNAGTLTCKAAPGAIKSLVINSASSGATVTMIDAVNSGGTVDIGVITLGAAVTTPMVVSYGGEGVAVTFNTGLTIVSTGTIDGTVVYR